MKTVIIKYNAGNIQSVLFALERLGVDATVTDDTTLIRAADKVIFPGVGEASSAMRYLRERELDTVIRDLRQPVLGICLGMQLLCRHSEENNTECLGIFDAQVRRFDQRLKVPQVGWNNIAKLQGPLFHGVATGSYCYFVHSYYAELSADTIATTGHGRSFSSALSRNNFYGVQFHTEKSASTGERILQNFLDL